LIPFRPEDDLLASLMPSALALALLAAGAGLAWFLKRRGVIGAGRQSGSRRLRVVERLPLSRRSTLILVEYDGHPMLIGESGGGLALLERRNGRRDAG
jgi:flagellar biogenesis protein FliO